MKKIIKSKLKSVLGVCSVSTFRFVKLTSLLFLVTMFNVMGSGPYLQLAAGEAEAGTVLQQREISGIVSGVDGNPLPGTTIIVEGTTIGTVTDAAGYFSLTIPTDAETLEFSFVGMERIRVELTTSNVYDVTLVQSAVDLDEIVVVGYGTVRRSDLTGSVSRVESERIALLAPTQLTETLSGTVAGLYSVQGASAGGGGSLEIRGPSSLAASTSPLIVLDGVIYNGSIRDINPADIETIDILRDASSSAVFGARAAAGIIVITTKRGELGKPVISFSAKNGVATTTNDFHYYGHGDPKEYFNYKRDLFRQENPELPEYYFHHPDDLPANISIDEWRNWNENPAADNLLEAANRINLWPVEVENLVAGRITDFYSEVIGPARRQDYNLSAGGATDDLRYYWSVGYLNNEGVIKGDQYATIRSRLNLDLDITNWLSVGTNTQFSNRDESVVQANLGQMSQQSPYGQMWNEDGALRRLPSGYTLNPLENYYGQERMRDINSLFSSLYAQVELPYGFSYRISFQPRFSFLKEYNFWSTKTTTGLQTHPGGYATRIENNSYEWMLDNLLKWNREIGVHNFDLTLLANAERFRSWQSWQSNSNFAPNENLGFHALQFGSNPSLSVSDSESSGDALMARLNYTLLGKYLFTGAVRRDGYSAFGQLNPRATFPSVAFAWQISEEPFYNSSLVNRLKLRLSWGANGNREIGAYSALARMGSVLRYDGARVVVGVFNTTLANPGLLWERTESFNIGFDIGIFENRIDMTIDAYDATTTDLLLNRDLPRITGFSSITSNLGELGNRGIETSINSVNINRANFTWRTNLVFSLNRNKIKKLWGDLGEYRLMGEDRSGELPDFTNQWFPGYARDIVWDYNVIGMWQLDERAEAAEFGLEPGEFKAEDVDEDRKYLQLEDKQFIGYTAPRHRWGLRNEVRLYRNFSVSMFIRADLGHIRNVPGIMGNKSTNDRRNDWGWDYWSPENPNAEFHRYKFPDNYGAYEGSLRIFKPTGFLRVQDVTLSYDLTTIAAQRLNLNSLRVMCTIRNLLTITNWPGFDPESSMAPMPRVFTVGVDLSL